MLHFANGDRGLVIAADAYYIRNQYSLRQKVYTNIKHKSIVIITAKLKLLEKRYLVIE